MTLNAILAMTKTGGIGISNKDCATLAWHVPEELKLFKEKTDNSILIMGRKTVESLPPIFYKANNRQIICVSSSKPVHVDVQTYQTVSQALEKAQEISLKENKKIFLCGGVSIYDSITTNTTLHISVMKKDYETNVNLLSKTLNFIRSNFIVVEKKEYEDFTHYVLVYDVNGSSNYESEYLTLLDNISNKGVVKFGRNGETLSIFHANLTFDLTKSFPLLTTKKMFWRGIVEELLFFMKGETQTKKLEEKGVNIWKGNTCRQFLDKLGFNDREDGDMGPMYGYQWRNFNGSGLDQLQNCIDLIKNDPDSRRILLTDFNPLQAHQGVLYPCHSIIIQFYVEGDYLDMFCYNRSSDMFLGIPFNIASSSLFLTIIAKLTNKTARYFHLTLGDAHIYREHTLQVSQQFLTFKHKPPTVKILRDIKTLKDLNDCVSSDFYLNNYTSEPVIKAEMIA